MTASLLLSCLINLSRTFRNHDSVKLGHINRTGNWGHINKVEIQYLNANEIIFMTVNMSVKCLVIIMGIDRIDFITYLSSIHTKGNSCHDLSLTKLWVEWLFFDTSHSFSVLFCY